jgi:hypothetical protein
MFNRFHEILNNISAQLTNKTITDYSYFPGDNERENYENEIQGKKIKNKKTKAEDGDFAEVEDMEEESPEMEMMEYKKDFYEMSVGSLRAIAQHASNILNSLENPTVKENLTESWLQGKIAITEDYMRTIHDFIMYVSEAADSISAADKPGLWENIRKKKERMGKNYKPSKPGDKGRPDPKQWKKLTKTDKKQDK